jgi:hypothetical protein
MDTIRLWAGAGAIVVPLFAGGCRSSSIEGTPDARDVQPQPAPAVEAAPADVVPTDAAPLDATVDLDAAMAGRARAVRSTLDADVPMRIEDGTYLLVGVDRGALTPGILHMFEQALAALYNRRFDRHPDHPIAVLLFTSHAHYVQFAPAGSLAYYKRKEAEIDVDLSWGDRYQSSAVHELVHSLIDPYFEHAPLWLSECLATLYENPSFPSPGEIRGLRGGLRQTTFHAALRSEADEADMRLDALFTMDPRAFKGYRLDGGGGADAGVDLWLQSRNESLARYVCLWLQDRGWLWDFVHRFRDGFDTDRSGMRSFEEVTGMSPVQATTSWIEWARRI